MNTKCRFISFEANWTLIRTVSFHWILALVTPPHCSTEIRPLSSDFQPSSHAPNAQKPSRQTSPDLPASSPSHITSVPFPGVTGKFSCSLRPVLGENWKHQEAALWTPLRSWWHQRPPGCVMFSGSGQPLKHPGREKRAVVLIQSWDFAQ